MQSSAAASATVAGTLPDAPALPLARTRATTRLLSIDIVRGLVIALMALDHVRAYFTDVRFPPLDLEHLPLDPRQRELPRRRIAQVEEVARPVEAPAVLLDRDRVAARHGQLLEHAAVDPPPSQMKGG